jgi:hypothetical protein
MLIAWLVGDNLLFSGILALWDNSYECVCCYNRCHGNAVKGFLGLMG